MKPIPLVKDFHLHRDSSLSLELKKPATYISDGVCMFCERKIEDGTLCVHDRYGSSTRLWHASCLREFLNLNWEFYREGSEDACQFCGGPTGGCIEQNGRALTKIVIHEKCVRPFIEKVEKVIKKSMPLILAYEV